MPDTGYLFLGGAPKCGTSTLFGWLSAHAAIGPSSPKETFYFVDDDSAFRRARHVSSHGVAGFDECFDGERLASATWRLEGSTHYLYQESTPGRLASLDGDVRVVFLLREPAARVLSSFQYTRNNLAAMREPLGFSQYLSLRASDPDALVRRFMEPRGATSLLREPDQSRYVRYLRHWAESLGKDRILVETLESMRLNPGQTVSRICRWLEMDASFYEGFEFARSNETRGHRWTSLHRVARRVGARFPTFAGRDALRRLYRRAASKPVAPLSDADQVALERLKMSYREDNEALSAEFGVDVRGWV